jgi:tripartite-type tricarboxylate transporter receptor subunit TctC
VPDGYTLIEGVWNTHVANGALYSLQYDALKDFEPIALISSFPYLIDANKTIPASDLKGLITWLKANPGKATEATIGAGSVQHVGGVVLQKMIGTRFQFVPYRGIAPAMQDLLAGHVDWTSATPDISLPHWPSGNIKIYAATTKMRLASAPDIPTADEAGLPLPIDLARHMGAQGDAAIGHCKAQCGGRGYAGRSDGARPAR